MEYRRRQRTPGRLVEVLREIREDAGLTQGQLAERLGCGLHKVSRIEEGWRSASLSDAAQIAAALGFRLEWRLIPVSRETNKTDTYPIC